MVESWRALHVTGIFPRISPQMHNSDIEKFILMDGSEDNFVLEIILSGCSSKTAAKIYSNGRTDFTFLTVTEERIFMDFL